MDFMQVCDYQQQFASIGASMTHEDLTDVLGQAGDYSQRVEGVRAAVRLGIPLIEIEEYLDWLDLTQSVGQVKDD